MMFDCILLFNFAPLQNKNAALQNSIYRLIKLVISITLCLLFTYKVTENQRDSRFLDAISCYINRLFSISCVLSYSRYFLWVASNLVFLRKI